MTFSVGERVFFWYPYSLDGTDAGALCLYAGKVVGIGDQRVVLERENDGKLCSVDYSENLVAVDGKDFGPPPPPEPKPPLHHEIIEARKAGFWLGFIAGSICTLFGASGLIIWFK